MRGDPVDVNTTKSDLGYFICSDRKASLARMCQKSGVPYRAKQSSGISKQGKTIYFHKEFSEKEEFSGTFSFERKVGLPIRNGVFSRKEFDRVFEFKGERCYLSYFSTRRDFDLLEKVWSFSFRLKAKIISSDEFVSLSDTLTDIRKRYHIPLPKNSDDLGRVLSKYFDVEYSTQRGDYHVRKRMEILAYNLADIAPPRCYVYNTMTQVAKEFETTVKNISIAIKCKASFPYRGEKWYYF